MTAALPIIADDGEIRGVLGLDIDLEQLSTFLASLQIGRSGRAMIIDETGRLVAYPDLTRLFKRVGEELQPVKLDDLGDPVLTPAFNHYRLEGHGHRALDVDQRRYISTASSLHATIGRHRRALFDPEDADSLIQLTAIASGTVGVRRVSLWWLVGGTPYDRLDHGAAQVL